MKNEITALWTVSTGNTKTGPMPTQYVGATQEESWESCEGCALRPDAMGGCYAWGGNSKRGANSVRRAALRRGRAATLAEVIERSPRSARRVRFGAIGDPSAINRAQLESDIAMARSQGFGVLGYTHFWRENPELRSDFLASVETIFDAVEAVSLGWRIAYAGSTEDVIDRLRDEGVKAIVCPNYARPEITCNVCGLCDVNKMTVDAIGFPAHGAGAQKLKSDDVPVHLKFDC